MTSKQPSTSIAELLARARANLAAKQEREAAEAAEALALQVSERGISNDDVSFDKAGIDAATLQTEEGREAAIEVLEDVSRNIANNVAKGQNDAIRQNLQVSCDETNATPKTQDISSQDTTLPKTKSYGVAKNVTLNAKQQEFLDTVLLDKSCVLIGAAGTGKTTSMREVTRQLIDSGKLREITLSTKWLQAGSPGAIILSFTRKAVNNIKHAVVDELKKNTLTIHKVLEFAPIFYEVDDPNSSKGYKTTMAFEPARNAVNPLPPEISLVVFEESSMVSVQLYEQLKDAMPHKHQEIFLGDIQQLPPVFGQAILGFKMLSLPVVELTEVYRQALESPIIELAWAILSGDSKRFSGKTIKAKEFVQVLNKEVERIKVPALEIFTKKTNAGEVKFQPWQKKLSSDYALNTFVKQMNTWSDQGYYDPQEDIILCPYNKAFGTIEINKGIAQHLGRKRDADVYHIIAGFDNHYLAVGDRVLYDKEDAFIETIAINGNYLGKRPSPHSKHLDRWGTYQQPLTAEELANTNEEDAAMDLETIEKFMASSVEKAEDRVQDASHVVTIRMAYGDGEIISLSKASEINNLLGGYAITVHKAQGSEYDRVFFVMHHTHAVMTQRELLYTAVTRAKKFLHVICEADTFEKGVASQKIEGNTIAEKAAWFNSKKSGPKERSYDETINYKSAK